MKGLLILFGETFRLGRQGTRSKGSEESYDEQIKAAKSHVKFIKNLNERNIDVSVNISSYETMFDNDLINVYKEILNKNMTFSSTFYKKMIGMNSLIHKYTSNVESYDFVLFMRADLFLKDKFLEIFDPTINKILFPSVCFEPYDKYWGDPRVNDMMCFIPKKYFKHIKHITLSHTTWYVLVRQYGFSYEDLDMMLKTYHDSDSAKDFNPIYYIVNRPECKKWHTVDKIFNKNNFSPV